MRRFRELLKNPWMAYTFATCSAVLLYLVLTHVPTILSVLSWFFSLISPVIVGAIVAYILNPLANFLETKVLKKIKKDSLRHTVAVLLIVVMLVLLLSLLLAALIPSLISSVKNLVSNRSDYIQKISHFVANFGNNMFHVKAETVTQTINNSVDSAISKASQNISAIFTTVKNVSSSVTNFAIGVLFGICFLLGKETILRLIKSIRHTYMSEERYEKNNAFWRSCHEIFTQYFSCTIVDALIIGVTTAIFMAICGLPYVALISVIVGVTNIIPTFGPAIGAVLGSFLLVLVKPSYALILIIFLVILQSLDGMVIKPKLFSSSLGLPAIWTIVAITLGGKIAGIPGIILSIPVAAILVILYKQTINPIMEKRKEKINSAPKDADDDDEDAVDEAIK